MADQKTEVQHVKMTNNYTGATHYGTVTSSTKCYINVTIKNYYGKGRNKVERLFKRDGAMYNWDNAYSYYLIFPEVFDEIELNESLNDIKTNVETLKTTPKHYYVVISSDGTFKVSNCHNTAFEFYSNLSAKIKGVYRFNGWSITGQAELVGLNLSGGLFSNSHDGYLLNFKQHLIDFISC